MMMVNYEDVLEHAEEMVRRCAHHLGQVVGQRSALDARIRLAEWDLKRWQAMHAAVRDITQTSPPPEVPL